MNPGERFCPNCGAPASGAPQPNDNARAEYSAQPGQAPYGTRTSGRPVSFGQQNIAVAIILSIVTLGIYSIIWFIRVVNQLNEASDEQNATSGGVVFLLTLVTCGIYFLVWSYRAGSQINQAKACRGLPVDTSAPTLYLILSLFTGSIVVDALLQNELNKIAALYGQPAA